MHNNVWFRSRLDIAEAGGSDNSEELGYDLMIKGYFTPIHPPNTAIYIYIYINYVFMIILGR